LLSLKLLHTRQSALLLFINTRTPPKTTLFPYTSLFRSPTAICTRAGASKRSRLKLPSPPRPSASSAPWIATSSGRGGFSTSRRRSEEHTSELQSRENLVCRLLLEKKKKYQL